MLDVVDQALVHRAKAERVHAFADQVIAGIGVARERVVRHVDEPQRQPPERRLGVGLEARLGCGAAVEPFAQGLEDLVLLRLAVAGDFWQVVNLGAAFADPVQVHPGQDLDQADAGLDRGVEFRGRLQKQLPAHRFVVHAAKPQGAFGKVA